jgi:hypothetical protein
MLALALVTLTLVLTDVQQLPVDERVLRSATEAALSGSGVVLRWDRAQARTGLHARDDEARVILLGRHPTQRGPERVLGAVLREPSRSRAIWLYVGEVHQVLEAGGLRSTGAGAIRELSVAVGRVLAHEVAHVLAPGHPHSGQGLMARTVDRRTLSRAGEPLDEACLSAIRTAMAPAGSPVATATATGPSTAAARAQEPAGASTP